MTPISSATPAQLAQHMRIRAARERLGMAAGPTVVERVEADARREFVAGLLRPTEKGTAAAAASLAKREASKRRTRLRKMSMRELANHIIDLEDMVAGLIRERERVP